MNRLLQRITRALAGDRIRPQPDPMPRLRWYE
jgi:hypothetical protein